MSIFEWLFERNNPGPVGGIKRSGNPDNWPRALIIIAGILSITALCWLVWYFMLKVAFKYDFYHNLISSVVLVLYLFVSGNYSVRPNYNNMGVFGIIDHPFRYTDDVNRWLFFLYVFLIPGKLIMVPIIKLSRLLLRYYHER